MPQCLIALGSNLGDREQILREAWRRIADLDESGNARLSRCHATAAVGGPAAQPDFLNAAGYLETSAAPLALLHHLQQIENDLGRVRDERWGPRSVDLDLLLYGDLAQRTVELTLPHPRMTYRRFVLEPAAELAPEMVHPINGWTVGRFLEHLNTAKDYVALALGDHLERHTVVRAIAARSQVCILTQDAALATPALPAAGQDAWLLSDFWPLELRARMPAPTTESTAVDRLPPPKLVVVVEDPQAHERRSELARNARRDTWEDLMRRPDTGPVLWLTTDSVTAVADEVVAALEAMR